TAHNAGRLLRPRGSISRACAIRRSAMRAEASSMRGGLVVLPDMHALVGRQIKLIAFFDAKSLIPSIDIADDAVGPVLARRVGIAHHLLAQKILAQRLFPDLAEGEEEALIAGLAVDHRRLFAGKGEMIGG